MKFRTLIIIILILMVGGLLLIAGCRWLIHDDSTYGPKVTSDGNGGAIAVYEDIKSYNERDFYTQKVSPAGKPLWGEKGVLLGTSNSQFSSFFTITL